MHTHIHTKYRNTVLLGMFVLLKDKQLNLVTGTQAKVLEANKRE